MLNRYYEQELHNLRVLAAQFGKKNPALAPLLGSSSAVDADVERLLEGVAFLSGLVHQRLDDDFPEFIQSVAQLLFPHFLRPLPCMTIMRYESRAPGAQSVSVPPGTTFASVDVDGQRTVFSSVFPVNVEPLAVQSVSWEHDERSGEISALCVDLQFNGIDASEWQGDSLRFWLGGSFNTGSRLFRLLMLNTKQIFIGAPDQNGIGLNKNNIQPFGFTATDPLLPWSEASHPAWRVLYEYFALPEKFLFVELNGLSKWQNRSGSRLRLKFVFDKVPNWAPEVSNNNFILNTSPAVNIYGQEAQPIQVDNRQPELRIRPANNRYRSSQIFSVDTVTARNPDGSEHSYRPFSAFIKNQPAYHIRLRPSTLTGDMEHFLTMPMTGNEQIQGKTLSVRLSCTDGSRPDGLRLGDVSQATDNSPTRLTFSNIMGVTPYRKANCEDELLWRVLSHLNANHMALSSADSLRNMLALYIPDQQKEARHSAAGMHQIESILNVSVSPQRRIVRGMPIDGSLVQIDCAGDHFPGPGSLYLFGCVLDEYLSGCTTINTFIALKIHDKVNGETLEWPARTGQDRLL